MLVPKNVQHFEGGNVLKRINATVRNAAVFRGECRPEESRTIPISKLLLSDAGQALYLLVARCSDYGFV